MSGNFPSNFKYSKDHEWVRIEGNIARMGITSFAQEQLGELVFVEVPEAGKEVKRGDAICVVESTKAASDVYAPLSGKIIKVNEELSSNPSLIDSSPHEAGWICEIELSNQGEIDDLLSSDQYSSLL